MLTTPAPSATPPRPNRVVPRWFAIPVVRGLGVVQASVASDDASVR